MLAPERVRLEIKYNGCKVMRALLVSAVIRRDADEIVRSTGGFMRRLMLVVTVGTAVALGVPTSHASPVQGCPAVNPGKPTCTFTVKKSATGGQAGVVATTTWRLSGAGR